MSVSSGSGIEQAETVLGALPSRRSGASFVWLKSGHLLAGRYEIKKGVGEGATGSVFQAFDRVVQGPVAIKIFRADLAADAQWSYRLGRELRYARRLQHANVCRVFDLGEAEGLRFLSMEFAVGGSLRAWLGHTAGPLRPLGDRIKDARAVIEGLAAIHAAGIVHRDVKPENVLRMADGRLVVTDFGLAMDPQHTTGVTGIVGTPSYMAPEIMMGRKASMASDVWSLGVMAHEILFGVRPEWRKVGRVRRLRTADDKSLTPTERALARLCEDCLMDLPTRPQDAVDVRKRLPSALAGTYRGRWARLRAARPVLLAAVALALLGAAVGRLLPAQRAPDIGRVEKAGAEKMPTEVGLIGRAADLSVNATRLALEDRKIRCLDALPGGKAVRAIAAGPVDLNVTTRQSTSARLPPGALQADCPRLSSDGNALLFTESVSTSTGPRFNILLARKDGAGRFGKVERVTEGALPEWLPNGRDFVYADDRSRAAVYALGKRNLLPDPEVAQTRIVALAANDDGREIVVLYRDLGAGGRGGAGTEAGQGGGHNSFVERYRYPELTRTASLSIRGATAHDLTFDRGRGRYLLFLKDEGVAELGPDNRLTRLGAFPNDTIMRGARTVEGLVFSTFRVSTSIWLHDSEGSPRVVARDGFAAVASSSGAVLFQKRDNGRTVIALKRLDDEEARILTPGPLDIQPSFGPRGETFLYIKANANTITHCAVGAGGAEHCRDVHADPLGPLGATLSPDGTRVAYYTRPMPVPRLSVVPLAGGPAVDLGEYSVPCRPMWSSPTGLWLYRRGEARGAPAPRWIEIDATTGAPTGMSHPAAPAAKDACSDAPGRTEQAIRFRVTASSKQSAELWLVPDPIYSAPSL